MKAPFSWPNRIDSTRFSGSAPQFTATKGLALRSPEPWIARAISSLPTPDSPSISTGIAEFAVFCAARSTARILALRVMMSLKLKVPPRLRLRRANSPSSARVAMALRSDTSMRSAPAGLTTKSTAPARIAETTVSMPPWAVWTMTGMAEPGLAHLAEHAEAVEIGHHEIEHDAFEVRAHRTPSSSAIAASPPSAVTTLIAGLFHHVLQEAALYGIVVDDEDALGHRAFPVGQTVRKFRLLSSIGLNGALP